MSKTHDLPARPARPALDFVPPTIGMWFALNTLAPLMEEDRTPSKRKSILERRSARSHHPDMDAESTSVRLIRKYADMIDGVDLEDADVGDRLDLPKREADVLIAEGWAERVKAERRVRLLPRRAVAADRTHQARKKSRK